MIIDDEQVVGTMQKRYVALLNRIVMTPPTTAVGLLIAPKIHEEVMNIYFIYFIHVFKFFILTLIILNKTKKNKNHKIIIYDSRFVNV